MPLFSFSNDFTFKKTIIEPRRQKMFRKRTINYCKKQLNMNSNIIYIIPNSKYQPKMDLINLEERQIIFSGDGKYVYVFDTNTKHELYQGDTNKFELLVYKKGFKKVCAYVNMDKLLTQVLGTNKINYESLKLKMLIIEWLYTFSNIYQMRGNGIKNKEERFKKASFELELAIYKQLIKRVEREFTKC